MVLYKRTQQQRWRVLDALAIGAAGAYAVGRLACLFAGDGCYGTWTNLPWGMHFPHGTAPSLLPRHPTPLYESLASLALLIFLFARKRKPGHTFLLFLMLSGALRFLVEFIRINHRIWLNLSLAQWIAQPLLTASTIVLFSRAKKLQHS